MDDYNVEETQEAYRQMTKHHKEKPYDVGVIVGRFQVPALTDAHSKLIEYVLSNHKKVQIYLGVAVTLGTKKNPLDFTSRKGMFKAYEEKYTDKLTIMPLLDVPCSDKDWCNYLDRMIRTVSPLGSVCLYGGRDSFLKSYRPFGSFDSYELMPLTEQEGTKVREETAKVVRMSEDFRAGQIYQALNQYPKVFPTVDIAVVKYHNDRTPYVLMGRKPTHIGFSFIGGFVDPTDASYEEAALRELREEASVEVDKNLTYIGSCRIDDSRYTGEERIVTTFYCANYVFGSGCNTTEFVESKWITVSKDSIDEIQQQHRPLFEMLIKHIEKVHNP